MKCGIFKYLSIGIGEAYDYKLGGFQKHVELKFFQSDTDIMLPLKI